MPSRPIKFSTCAFSVGEYWDSAKMAAHRKYRSYSEMQSTSGKDTLHVLLLKTVWGKAFYELSRLCVKLSKPKKLRYTKSQLMTMSHVETSTNSSSHQTWIGREVEYEAREEGEEEARNDDIYNEVERQALHHKVIRDVDVQSVRTAGIVHIVCPASITFHHPFTTFRKIAKVRLHVLLHRSNTK